MNESESTLPAIKKWPCLVCGSDRLKYLSDYGRISRITSDCKPFPSGGKLATCADCGGVQKMPDKRLHREVARIYAQYQAYFQAGGAEQMAFDAEKGEIRPRSAILINRIKRCAALPTQGTMLDVGCGSGVTLRAFSQHFPQWILDGLELSADTENMLVSIPGFRTCHVGGKGLAAIEGNYQLISFVHSLEHFFAPLPELIAVKARLASDGALFVQVCNIEENPFDLLIADHVLHFSPNSLCTLMRCAGLTPLSIETSWVAKEISALAVNKTDTGGASFTMPTSKWAGVESSLHWLTQLSEWARKQVNSGYQVGVFGTSIASSWLSHELEGKNAFFVDEDAARIGRHYLGRPVIAPRDVRPDDIVLLGLAPSTASQLQERLKSSFAGNWMLPPALF